jgi:glucosylceramidase
MLKKTILSLVILIALIGCKKTGPNLMSWITSPTQDYFFEQQPVIQFTNASEEILSIEINESISYQQMEGYGFTLTQGSAQHLKNMDENAREELLVELFGNTENSIGINYLRVSVGASDLNDSIYFYSHKMENQDDLEGNFDFGPDNDHVIPILKQIKNINSEIKLMASPWSAPLFMKSDSSSRGGRLMPEFYDEYAIYLADYLSKMNEEGLSIDALTIQNEPLNGLNNPSMLMSAKEQLDFIKNHLGPLFEERGIPTKIIIYDHNPDRIDYPLTILNDADAKKYIHGTAFHLYAGRIESLSKVHKQHPDKHIYFTEQWVSASGKIADDIFWHAKNVLIGASRNWAKVILEWNLSSNPSLTPFTENGGCHNCLGAITIDGNEVTRNAAYFLMAHATKFITPNSLRIDSNEIDQLPNVAFKTPEGKYVLIVLNTSSEETNFQIKHFEQYAQLKLPAGALATYYW